MDSERTSEAYLDNVIREILTPLYEHRVTRLDQLKLTDILHKNMYMFRAWAINAPNEFIEAVLNAFISSSDETKFGVRFFEKVVKQVSQGEITDTKGMDMVIEKPEGRILLEIKSGTKWSNRDSWDSMVRHFATAQGACSTDPNRRRLVGILGHCYGKRNEEPTADRPFYIMSGQRFWEYLTGDADFYLKLLRSIGRVADTHKHGYDEAFIRAKGRLLAELAQDYCTAEGLIDWERIIQFNSAS